MADDESSILKSMVFVVAFSAIFGLLFAYSSPIFGAPDPPDPSDFITRNFDPETIGTTTFFYDPGNDNFQGVNITELVDWNSYVTYPIINGAPSSDGDYWELTDGVDTIRIYPVGPDADGPKGQDMALADSFLIYEQWGLWSRDYESISFNAIISAAQQTESGYEARFTVDLDEKVTLWFIFNTEIFDDDLTVADFLEMGWGYQIVIGQSLLDAAEGSQNIWGAISGIMTFNIKTGIAVLDFLISLPIWVTITYITLTVVSKLIPGLG